MNIRLLLRIRYHRLCFNFCFSSLAGIPIGIVSSVIGLKICPVITGISKSKISQ